MNVGYEWMDLVESSLVMTTVTTRLVGSVVVQSYMGEMVVTGVEDSKATKRLAVEAGNV